MTGLGRYRWIAAAPLLAVAGMLAASYTVVVALADLVGQFDDEEWT